MFYAFSRMLQVSASQPLRFFRKKKYEVNQIKYIVRFKCNQSRYSAKQKQLMHHILRLEQQPYANIYAQPAQYIPLIAEYKRPFMAAAKIIQFKIWAAQKNKSKRKYQRYLGNFYKNQYYYPALFKTYMEKELKQYQDFLYAPILKNDDDIFAYYMQLYDKNFTS